MCTVLLDVYGRRNPAYYLCMDILTQHLNDVGAMNQKVPNRAELGVSFDAVSGATDSGLKGW